MQSQHKQGMFMLDRRTRITGVQIGVRITALLVVSLCACLSVGGLLLTRSQQAAHAANPPMMGVNLSGPCDWCGDYTFADAMKNARHWGSTNAPWDEAASVDANGWPRQDAGAVILLPPSGFSIDGTYRLSFTGQATVSGVASSITVQNQNYNSGTNTTTADLLVGVNSQIDLAFTNTKRNPGDSAGTGITNVKLMMPTSFGGTTPYDPSVTFTTVAKNFLQKFRVIRYMDYMATNGNTQVNWSDRRPPNYASMAAGGTGSGAAWEYIIQLSNETGVDPYINVPAQATDDYISHLAQLFKYGSDANGNVYTSPQSSPAHAPLNSNLHLYIEYSNEVWNGSFAQAHQNHDAAVAEVNAGGSPLNYDGDPNDWYWAWRRIGKRIHDISEIFRGVFGNSAMPDGNAQIRPVLEWQYGNAQDTAHQALSFLDNYYNNADGIQHVSTPHPINYFIWGGGGAAYSGVNDPNASTVDAIYNSGYSSGVVPDTIKADVTWARSYGLLHDVAYEGGFQIGGDSPTALQLQANLDPRAKQMEIDTQTKFNQAGGELLVYFNANSSNYGLARPTIANTDAPKVQAIDALNQSTAAAPTNGTTLPAVIPINSGSFGLGARVNSLVISPSASSYSATLNMTTSYSSNKLQILVNNVVVQTITVAQTSQQTSNVTLNSISLPAGVSAISIKGLSPVDTVLNSLTLSNGTPITITPTATAVPLQQADIMQATAAPSIDGNASDAVWSSASSNAITHPIKSPSGFSASFQSAWDSNNLYFLVKISDSTYSSHNDAVEIYIDPTHNGGTSYDPKDMQYAFASNSTTVVQYNNGQQGTNTAGIAFSNAAVSGGYNVEVKIPWSTLGVTASANMVIGLDIDAVQNTSVNNKLFWNTTTDNAWNTPAAFGRGVLQTSGGGGGSLPTPWQDGDVGTVGSAGSASYSNGTFTVKGSGGDIWGGGDAFNYVYQSLNGDGSIVARVSGVQNTDPWAKAGVMIRETLNGNSTFAGTFITPGNGAAFQYRSTTGGNAASPGSQAASAPYWVRLVRSGNTFTSSVSSDGINWTQIGSTTISMASNVYIGLAVTAHNNSALNTSTFDNVSATTGTGTWTKCADEGGTCSFSGTRQVRYGANGQYNYKNATGSIGCNNTVFGDPIVGTIKACYYQ